jgi:hypothetical protein
MVSSWCSARRSIRLWLGSGKPTDNRSRKEKAGDAALWFGKQLLTWVNALPDALAKINSGGQSWTFS